MPETSRHDAVAPRLSIEMCGANLVIRSTASVDKDDVAALADAVNAATATRSVVVIDPAPVRCDDAFVAMAVPTATPGCVDHDDWEPVDVKVMQGAMIRVSAERDPWIIDLQNGRICRTVPRDVRYLGPGDWTPVIAVMVTPRRLIALTTNGITISGNRAHRAVPRLPEASA